MKLNKTITKYLRSLLENELKYEGQKEFKAIIEQIYSAGYDEGHTVGWESGQDFG